MTIIDKITSRSEDYKEQYDNELSDYIKNFDGKEKQYLIEQIQILEGAKFYLMSGFYQKSFEEKYKHLDLKEIALAIDKECEILPKRLSNSISVKLDFLHNKLKIIKIKWTKFLPKESGFYWMKFDGDINENAKPIYFDNSIKYVYMIGNDIPLGMNCQDFERFVFSKEKLICNAELRYVWL